MAIGLREGDDGNHLITFHPRGPGLSSDYFHTTEWLDFNMYQSSHAGHDHDNGLYAEHDYSLEPGKTYDWMGNPDMKTYRLGFILRDSTGRTGSTIMMFAKPLTGLFWQGHVVIPMAIAVSGKCTIQDGNQLSRQ